MPYNIGVANLFRTWCSTWQWSNLPVPYPSHATQLLKVRHDARCTTFKNVRAVLHMTPKSCSSIASIVIFPFTLVTCVAINFINGFWHWSSHLKLSPMRYSWLSLDVRMSASRRGWWFQPSPKSVPYLRLLSRDRKLPWFV